MKKYCVGFVFDRRFQRVLLIRKARPRWQLGRLNGIGGAVKGEESPRAAMLREGREEAGLKDLPGSFEWEHFSTMRFYGEQTVLDLFYVASDDAIASAQTMTDETVEVVPVHHLPVDCLDDVPWMVSMAMSCARSVQPRFYNIEIS